MNPYKILGVKANADQDTIRAAFKKLAKKHHPDVAGGENEKFTTIKASYDLLMNEMDRRIYDEFGIVLGDAAGEMRLIAIKVITETFHQMIQKFSAEQLARYDLLVVLKEKTTAEIGQIEADMRAARENESKLIAVKELINKRMTHSKKIKTNIFLRSVEQAISIAPSRISALLREQKIRQEILILLDEFAFDFEKSPRGMMRHTIIISSSTAI